MIFYRNIVQAALEITPSQTMRAITDEVVDFQMPGSDHPGLRPQGGADGRGRHLRPAHPPRRHRRPLLRQWGVFELEGLDAEGEQAREELAAAVAALDDEASRFVARREEMAAKKAARQSS